MQAKLDFLVRFWDLAARHSGAGLSQPEEVEYFALLQMVIDDLEQPTAAPRQKSYEAKGSLSGDGSIVSARILSVSAGGILVRAGLLPEVGAEVLLSIVEPEHGTEVMLPCRVLWLDGGNSQVLALQVDGVPLRSAREHGLEIPVLGSLGVPRARGSRPGMAA